MLYVLIGQKKKKKEKLAYNVVYILTETLFDKACHI